MLKEIEKSYEQFADNVVPGWRTLSKSDLCRHYITHKDNPQLRSGYFAALVVRYWGVIYKFQRNSPGFTFDDFYDWLIRGLLYILNRHPWDDPTQKIYNDPQGPDKAVNRCLKSTRLLFYEHHNTFKRRANIGTYSVENICDLVTTGDMTLPEVFKVSFEPADDIVTQLIRDSFNKKNYFMGFMVYFIAFFNVFDTVEENGVWKTVFNQKRLMSYMHSISPMICTTIAEEFGLNELELLNASNEYNNLYYATLKNAIKRNMQMLAHSKFFSND